MVFARGLLAISAAILVALIIWAALQVNLFDSFGPILADPWGLVAIVDLYVGFIAMSVLVWFLEPDWRVRIGVIVPLYFLGNPWAILWIIWRLPSLVARLKS